MANLWINLASNKSDVKTLQIGDQKFALKSAKIHWASEKLTRNKHQIPKTQSKSNEMNEHEIDLDWSCVVRMSERRTHVSAWLEKEISQTLLWCPNFPRRRPYKQILNEWLEWQQIAIEAFLHRPINPDLGHINLLTAETFRTSWPSTGLGHPDTLSASSLSSEKNKSAEWSHEICLLCSLNICVKTWDWMLHNSYLQAMQKTRDRNPIYFDHRQREKTTSSCCDHHHIFQSSKSLLAIFLLWGVKFRIRFVKLARPQWILEPKKGKCLKMSPIPNLSRTRFHVALHMFTYPVPKGTRASNLHTRNMSDLLTFRIIWANIK